MVQLIELLGNRLLLRILQFFSDNPRESFYVEEVRKKLKIAKASAIKWFHILEKGGLLTSKRVGRAINYSLNTEDALVKQLRILLVVYELKALKELKSICDSIYLFGSSARGEYLSDSDIDLLIISNETITKVTSELRKIKTSREVKPVIMTQLDYSILSRNDPAFYNRIEKDKVRLL